MSLLLFTASGPSVSGLPDYYQTLSRKVYQILEDIGANVERRKRMMTFCITKEILSRIPGTSMAMDIFGSFYEGTTTADMESDIDMVTISRDLPVVTNPTDHPVGTCLLLVQDQSTHPGYCKLQLVENGRPIWGSNAAVTWRLSAEQPFLRFYTDKNNRLV